MINVAAHLKRSLLVLILAFILWLSMQLVVPVHAGEAGGESILIKFAETTTEAERASVIDQLGGELVRWIAPIHTAQITMSRTNDSADGVAGAMSSPYVISAEMDGFIGAVPIVEEVQTRSAYGQSTVPPAPVQVNDPDFNNPQRVYAPQLINVPGAWRYHMGNPQVVVAVVDSGVNAAHPDLAGRVLPGYDFVNNDADPTDDHGHGTHVAGIIAANANNGIGNAGVCPNCSILPVKVLDASNVGTWSNVAAGIVYAVDKGARIINLSLGGNSNTQIIQDAVTYAVQKGVLVVAAAGNSRTDTPFYPAALESVIAVSATRQDDTRWSLSNFGDWIDIAAPGYAVYSAYHDTSNFYGGYTFMSGTSMASPHVAGVAGLILSQRVERTPVDVRGLLFTTAVDLGNPGEDAEFGLGRLDANRALEAGMPQPKADAMLGGMVWQDQNANGAWEQEETAGGATVIVRVMTLDNTVVGTAAVAGSGEWRVEKLHAGSYKVSAEASGRLILTTQSEYVVELAESQSILNLNFGAAVDATDFSNQVFVPAIMNR